MTALVSSDELAKDVTGAEALLERHKVCRMFLFGDQENFLLEEEAGRWKQI